MTILVKLRLLKNVHSFNLMLDFVFLNDFLIDFIFVIDFLIADGKFILDLKIIYN